MKKFLICAALFAFNLCASAQNVQVHYDLGRALYDNLDNRPAVTTTFEMFKPDKWGSTFLFADIDYGHDGVAGAYWEIAREFNVSDNKRWALHAEYDGGLSSDKYTEYATRFQHAVLVGPAWNWASRDFSKTFSVQLMYKYYFKGQYEWNRPYSGVQLTGVWGMDIAGKALTFSGFCDVWYDNSVNGNFIVMAEPQLWFNFNTMKGWKDVNLSVGTEVEISNNFIWNSRGENNRFYAIPTVAAKWTF